MLRKLWMALMSLPALALLSGAVYHVATNGNMLPGTPGNEASRWVVPVLLALAGAWAAAIYNDL